MATTPFIGIYWKRFWSWMASKWKVHCCTTPHK